MTENEFIEKYNSDNFDSYIKENATIDYWNDLIKTYKIERLNLSSNVTAMFAFNHEIKEGKSLLGKEFDGFCEKQIKILEIENQYKPKLNEKKIKSLSTIETFHIGFNDIAKEKIYKLKLSEEQKEELGFNKKGKSIWDYFESYLNDKKLLHRLQMEFSKYIEKTLPKEVSENCLFCSENDETIPEEERNCYNYYVEAQMNEFVAVWWFVNIVEKNKHLLNEKDSLKKLSIRLYECFLFKDGRVFFDLRKLTMYCLEQGFLSLSKIFANNDKINNLEIINQAIDDLESEYLSIKMFEKSEPYHIEPQKMFFENKRKSIKEQLKIDRLKSKQNPPQQLEANKLDEALLKNEYIKIFKNDLGFTLFTKMFELYKPDNKDLANFSFLFFAMEKDFLVCSQVDFVKFLEIEKYNVSIEKIDNRQFKWQINKKSKLYNSIKEPLQKKHEKSTI